MGAPRTRSRGLTLTMLPTRRALALCLAFAATVCTAATTLRAESNRKSLAFASSFSPSLFRSTAATSAQSPFFGEISRASVSVEEVTEGVQAITMGSRRNLKKEKRLRNEHCARQYRKPKARFSRGGGRAARAEADNKDNE